MKSKCDSICYEGDCFIFHLNPNTDVVPNCADGGTPLKPERLEGTSADRIQACSRALHEGFIKIAQGTGVDLQAWEDFFGHL